MFDLDALIANKDLILKDRDNRADVQKVLSVYAEKVGSDYTVKAKWSDIFDALLQGMKVQAQVISIEGGGESQPIFEGDVETVEDFPASGMNGGTLDGVFVTVETITVTFDGTEYTLSRAEPYEGFYEYGESDETGPDFTNYPFYIVTPPNFEDGSVLYTETAGTYSLKIAEGGSSSAVVETYDLYDATVTANGFKVNGTDLSASSADAYPVGSLSRPSSGGGGEGGGVLMCTKEKHVDGDDVYYTLDHTWQEIKDAIDGGSIVAVRFSSGDVVTVQFVAQVLVFDSTFVVAVETRETDSGAVVLDDYDSDSADGTPTMSDGGR